MEPLLKILLTKERLDRKVFLILISTEGKISIDFFHSISELNTCDRRMNKYIEVKYTHDLVSRITKMVNDNIFSYDSNEIPTVDIKQRFIATLTPPTPPPPVPSAPPAEWDSRYPMPLGTH